MRKSKREAAKKRSAARTANYFRTRAARGGPAKALEILSRAGVGNPPIKTIVLYL
jgi:hypothetical protein